MIKSYRSIFHLFSRDARLILLATALDGFAYLGIYAMLFNLYLLRLDYGPDFIGLVNGSALLGFALFSLPGGALGRRWGSRRLTVIGFAVSAFSLGVLPLAELLPAAWQAGWLLATYSLAWISAAVYVVNIYPFLMRVTGPAERSHVFSVREAVFPLAGFAGSLTAGLLPALFAGLLGVSAGHSAPYQLALFLAAVLTIPGLIALMATRNAPEDEYQQDQAEPSGRGPYELIAVMALIAMLLVAGQGATGTFFNVYLDDGLGVPTALIGGLAAAGQLAAGLGALAMPLAVARWRKRKTIIIGISGVALSMLPLAFVPHWGAAGLGFIGVSALFAFTLPALQITQQEIVPPAWRAVMAGSVSTATGLSGATMAFGGGYLITAFGYSTLFLTGAALAGLAAASFWLFTWIPRWMMTRRAVAP